MRSALVAQGVPPAAAARAAGLPPVGSLFAAFLGYNPMRTLLGPALLASLPPAKAAFLTGTTFFPRLIAEPFMRGLRIAFTSSLVMCLVAAAASWLRGGRYVHEGGTATAAGAAPDVRERPERAAVERAEEPSEVRR
jgi:hypothetical protein